MQIEIDKKDAERLLYLLESLAPKIKAYEGLRHRFTEAYIHSVVEHTAEEERDRVIKYLNKNRGRLGKRHIENA